MPQSQAALTFAQWGTPPEGPPFPSMLVSKHIPSAKKTPICSTCKGCQSVTERYNFDEPGLPISPLQGGPAFLLSAPLCSARHLSYVHLRAHRDVSYIRLRKYLSDVLWSLLDRLGRGYAELRYNGVLRSWYRASGSGIMLVVERDDPL
jgi:hypothetical protein